MVAALVRVIVKAVLSKSKTSCAQKNSKKRRKNNERMRRSSRKQQ
jgi:hypothetical protein